MNTCTHQPLLAQAERLCLQRGVRLTPQRLTVLHLLSQQDKAISAYALLDLLRVIEPQAKPPTIYRALDFLLEQGFIHKIESTNSYIVCDHFDHPAHVSVLMICNSCGQVSEKSASTIEESLRKLSTATGFALQHSVVEVHGICQSCQQPA